MQATTAMLRLHTVRQGLGRPVAGCLHQPSSPVPRCSQFWEVWTGEQCLLVVGRATFSKCALTSQVLQSTGLFPIDQPDLLPLPETVDRGLSSLCILCSDH